MKVFQIKLSEIIDLIHYKVRSVLQPFLAVINVCWDKSSKRIDDKIINILDIIVLLFLFQWP